MPPWFDRPSARSCPAADRRVGAGSIMTATESAAGASPPAVILMTTRSPNSIYLVGADRFLALGWLDQRFSAGAAFDGRLVRLAGPLDDTYLLICPSAAWPPRAGKSSAIARPASGDHACLPAGNGRTSPRAMPTAASALLLPRARCSPIGTAGPRHRIGVCVAIANSSPPCERELTRRSSLLISAPLDRRPSIVTPSIDQWLSAVCLGRVSKTRLA